MVFLYCRYASYSLGFSGSGFEGCCLHDELNYMQFPEGQPTSFLSLQYYHNPNFMHAVVCHKTLNVHSYLCSSFDDIQAQIRAKSEVSTHG